MFLRDGLFIKTLVTFLSWFYMNVYKLVYTEVVFYSDSIIFILSGKDFSNNYISLYSSILSIVFGKLSARRNMLPNLYRTSEYFICSR